MCDPCLAIEQELHEARFIIDFLYEALGPAADDIMAMACEEYKEILNNG